MSDVPPSDGKTINVYQNGRNDVWTYRCIAASLGLISFGCGLGVTLIALYGKEVPPSLPALGGTAIGALAGMLASVSKNHG